MKQNFIFSTGLVNPFESVDKDRRFFICPEDRTEFTEYGNQPKVFAIACEVRSTLWLARVNKKNRMKRRQDVSDIDRVTGRLAFVHKDAWYLNSLTRRGRSWVRLAPKSPNAQWLERQGYETPPF